MVEQQGYRRAVRPVLKILQELSAECPVSVRICGACMEPRIPNGAVVRVARRRFYLPGDVLVFCGADDRLTAHRLVGAWWWLGRFRLFTRGDKALGLDSAILVSDVVGRVVGGDCAAEIARVPLSHRAKALRLFFGSVLRRRFALRGPAAPARRTR